VTTTDGIVTVCIPTFQAESFIDRTLQCARDQSYAAQRVVVSIDQSDDGTEEICRTHARADDRIEVHVHGARLGWVGNVNFLLDSVRSEFAFIYFHDDEIEPTYTESLVAALRRRPDAVSAHCDVVLYGTGSEKLRRGSNYDGSPAERLLTYLISPDRGELLRSLVRTASPASQIRMTPAGARYEMALVMAGPAVRVAEPLYRRWEQRTGGLTDGFTRYPFDKVVDGCRNNAIMARALVDDLQPTETERAQLEFGLAVYFTKRLRWLEAAHAAPRLVELDEVLEEPAELQLPSAANELRADLLELSTTALTAVRARTAARARQLSGPATTA
jgi:Glycosyl transferase family 2